MSYSYSGNLGNLGGGAQKWYFGQQAKICDAMSRGDLKQAIEFAAAMGELGIHGKTYDEVISSPTLLKIFKDKFNSFKGTMPSYSDDVVNKGNALLDAAIANLQPPAPVSPCGPLPAGVSPQEAICCENLQEWMPRVPGDPDPCYPVAPQPMPGMMPGTYLDEDIVISNEPVVSPIAIIIGILAVAGLTIFVVVRKMRS